MLRFIGLVWDDVSREQQCSARHLIGVLREKSRPWQIAFDAPGFTVLCLDAAAATRTINVIPDGIGVVLGTLFTGRRDIFDDSRSSPVLITQAQGESIERTNGRWLIDECWGNYIAFVYQARSRTALILRDPTSTLPCFCTVANSITIFFSHLADYLSTDFSTFTLNQEYLRGRVVGSGSGVQTSLRELVQVHRGECLSVLPGNGGPSFSRHLFWTPHEVQKRKGFLYDPALAGRALQATVRACVHSWAQGHSHLLHRLSGGLDSSIVLACLKAAPTQPSITCHTYFDPHGRSDERPWARLAARDTGCQHIEHPYDPSTVTLQAVASVPRSVEPIPAVGYLHIIPTEARLAAECGATAIFNGDGGDSGFCSDTSPLALIDFFAHHGAKARALPLAAQVALATDLSVWTVMCRSTRRFLFGSKIADQGGAEERELINPELRKHEAQLTHYHHPWFSNFRSIPWATIQRVGSLISTPELHEYPGMPAGHWPEAVSPLYSQPAVELFLQIPLYMHFEHGCDRGLARRAFSEHIPRPIVRRLWKDRAPQFVEQIIARNLAFLRETLLDGVLVKHGLLDRVAIERALSSELNKSRAVPGEILLHTNTEIWARHWTS